MYLCISWCLPKCYRFYKKILSILFFYTKITYFTPLAPVYVQTNKYSGLLYELYSQFAVCSIVLKVIPWLHKSLSAPKKEKTNPKLLSRNISHKVCQTFTSHFVCSLIVFGWWSLSWIPLGFHNAQYKSRAEL
jgi:hypothetical protein